MVRVTLIAFSLLVLAGCAAEEDAPPPPRVTGAEQVVEVGRMPFRNAPG
jgi:nitrous oxide reductase accessory protein NosL